MIEQGHSRTSLLKLKEEFPNSESYISERKLFLKLNLDRKITFQLGSHLTYIHIWLFENIGVAVTAMRNKIL